MTAKQTTAHIQKIKELTRKTATSKRAARKFLKKAGVITASGNLTRKYASTKAA